MASKTRASSLFFLPTTLPLVLLFTSTTLTIHTQSQTQDSGSDSDYNACKPFMCGNINFTFPFASSEPGSGAFDCGLPRFKIFCDRDAYASSSIPRLKLSGRLYKVKSLFSSERVVTVVDHELIDGLTFDSSCKSLRNLTIPAFNSSCESLRNLTIPAANGTCGAELSLASGANLTVFECPDGISLSSRDGVFGNYSCGEGSKLYFNRDQFQGVSPVVPVEVPSGCKYVNLPVLALSRNQMKAVLDAPNVMKILTYWLEDGFLLRWPDFEECTGCEKTGGRCGYDRSFRRIICFCKGLQPNLHALGGCLVALLTDDDVAAGIEASELKKLAQPSEGLEPRRKPKKSNKWKVIAGAATGTLSALLLVVLLVMFKYKHRISAILKPTYDGENHMTGIEINAKEFVKTYQSTLVANYSYNDIKKMTTGFKEKLGEGGYGTVYQGRLSDGRLIAVKLLENYKDKGQNFLNEVTTIGRIHHVNVIRLLGFCWDGSKQALIYEYMPNKSLGDQMFQGERSVSLGLAKLLEIAIGVAHGIEYLHNGCDSRILHLDIKPQNVLLDQNFNPKISDFGLAKVYSRNRSAITMTGARGTIGYIAPEIFLRNLGNPSHKSDVYSFGMLLLEMIGVNKRVEVKPDVNTSSSEAYFPGWVYDRLIEEKEMDLELGDSIVGEEVFIARKMVMVGLWCIQMNPKDRPSMTRVVEMLCGDMEAIEMPPKPHFFSPPRVHVEQEIKSLESESSELPLTSEVVVRSHEN
ncbi:hypothetical protein RHMOL_Rhmol09G0153200 [Rhododendron molle]|uniref:Uncharacterized protein n=1 Tax=Rhododendron molle TaxID=49168 RepID=A0ACC0MET8_RHOML|nr:hypothetical protein RHMOL_Rhmol09G0153200 [Rhododendron molle]